MHDKQPTLLLTRPKLRSAEFLSECEKLAESRLPVVISPIIRIEVATTMPDLDAYATLIFTSANGVDACSGDLSGRRVVTVGTKTCDMARRAGAMAECLGNDVDAFLAAASNVTGPALHCRGAHARGDLVGRMRAMGIETDEAVVYDQVAQPLTSAASALLQGKAPVVAPLFSPRSARLLSEKAINADTKIIAMSAAVASSWSGPGEIEIAASPTAMNMAKLTVRHF